MRCAFTSDIHGKKKKYEALFDFVKCKELEALFIGGDILPPAIDRNRDLDGFLKDYLYKSLKDVKASCEDLRIFLIMGNDDPRSYESMLEDWDSEGVIHYVNERTEAFDSLFVTGYNYIPPSPFRLKDWERYDVSRFVDVGSLSPEEGVRTVEVPQRKIKYSTIKEDLEKFAEKSPPSKTIYLFHTPPYETDLDRADLDGKKVDHAPLDVHVGSIAVKRFIEEEKPLLTLHGHVHETVDMTGEWRDKIGETHCFTGVHEGSELPVVQFDTDELERAERHLLEV